jgi:hypothetical protein
LKRGRSEMFGKRCPIRRKGVMTCLLSPLFWANGCTSIWAPRVDVIKVPPGRYFKWDVGPKDSHIEQEFIVKEYRSYHFNIGFGSPVAWDDRTNQDWRNDGRIFDFIGWGGVIGYLNGDGARVKLMDHTGIMIPVYNPKNDLGVAIPIHIQVQKLSKSDSVVGTMVDARVDTRSSFASGSLVQRQIVVVKLQEGKYRVIATALQQTIVPSGVGTYLNIGFDPKSTPIKSNE